jgi:hypothetical protein
MAAATWAMACVLLAANAAPPDVFYINRRDMLIPPGVIDPRRLPEIKEFVLYQLAPDNRTWQVCGRAAPETKGIPFTAYDDGTYYFKLALMNSRTNKQEPEDIYRAGEVHRIVVDTVPPVLRLVSAERQGDEVAVRWEVQEANPDWPSLRLEYLPTQGGLWSVAPVDAPQSGQATFRASGPVVAVRMAMRDLAKNESNRPELPVKNGGGVETAGSTGTSLPPLPNGGGETAPGPLQVGDSGWSPTPPGGATPAVLTKTTPRAGPDASDGGKPAVVAAAGSSGGPAGAAPPAPSPAPRGPLPPVKMVRKRQISIDYELTKFGPSGVKSVELYVTRDDGRTWQRSDGEEDISAAPVADAHGLAASLKRSLTVDLPADGLYGFYLVSKSGAGRGKPPPKDGIDVPQLRVEVDTTFPQAELCEPMPHPTRRDCLVLCWIASDNKLGPTPVTLEWAERPDGEWHPIGGGPLPNAGEFVGQVKQITGSYVWQVPATIPAHVYLKMHVRDEAGNESVAQTGKPVLVDLSEPEVKPLQISVGPR